MKKVLTFDISSTNIRCALVNEKFEVEKTINLSTVTGDPEVFMNNCIKLVQDFPLDDVVAIGAGVPGVVNRETGEILYFSYVHFKNVQLVKFKLKNSIFQSMSEMM